MRKQNESSVSCNFSFLTMMEKRHVSRHTVFSLIDAQVFELRRIIAHSLIDAHDGLRLETCT